MRIAIYANDRPKSQAVKKKLRQKFVERHFVLDDVNPMLWLRSEVMVRYCLPSITMKVSSNKLDL